jgi:hypothetical protein
MIFRQNWWCVMTSATLVVGRADLAYFRNGIGAKEAEPSQLGGLFDFEKQMKIFVVQKMPDPRDTDQNALDGMHFVKKNERTRVCSSYELSRVCNSWPVKCRSFLWSRE